MQRSNNVRAIVDADLLLQRSRAWGQRALLAQRRGNAGDSSACSHLGIIYFLDIFISFVTAAYLYFGYIHRLSLYLYLY